MKIKGKIENWKQVVGFEGFYEVSNLGRVRSSRKGKNTFPGRILHLSERGRGYLGASLTKPGVRKNFTVHSLVCEAFLKIRPLGMTVNHIDGIKANNNFENLEYVTQAENNKHAYRTGLKSNHGENHSRRKLNNINVLDIRELSSKGINDREIGIKFSIHRRTVSHIINRTRWGHI